MNATNTQGQTVAQRVTRVVAIYAGQRVDEIKPADHFFADLDFDSLDMVELVMDIEEEFAIEIPDEDWEGKWSTVQNVVDCVKARLPRLV